MGREGETGFGGEVGLRDVAYNAGGRGRALVFTRGLGENHMDGGGSPAKLGILDADSRRARGSSTEKLEIESDAMRLLVRGKGGVEVELRGCEDGARDDTTMGYGTDCPGIVEDGGIGPGVDGFHGGGFGESGHCIRLLASFAVP